MANDAGVMVNEEDHLRLQVFRSGFDVGGAFQAATKLDRELGGEVPYAFHQEFGFLTSCPTNTGTGMRASVLIHLPGLVLTQEIAKVLQGLQQMGLTYRGMYGEGSEVVGNFFQISNQTTMGRSEDELAEHLTRVVRRVIEQEEEARRVLLRDAGYIIEDKLWRAYGTLRHARSLPADEAMNLLSGVRLAVGLQLLSGLSVYTLNKLLIFSQLAHLSLEGGTDADGERGEPGARAPRTAGARERGGGWPTGDPGPAAPSTGELMNGYNFTERVRKVLAMAREEAARLHHEYVGTEHILLGLIREGEGVAAAVLQNLSVDLDEIQQKIEETVKKGKAAAATGPDLPYTSRAKKVLELAMGEARDLSHGYVGTEHLLLGLLREEKGIAAQVLTDAGVNLDAAKAETLRLLGTEMPQTGTAAAGGAPSPQPAPSTKGEKKVEDARARPFLQRPDAARRRQPARSDDRAREGNRARDGDPHAPQEEQPGAHRRAWRGQDGHRRRARAAHRQRRVPGLASRQPRAVARHGGGDRRHQVSRPVRGAPQGGHERDRAEQERHPVHRRAAHARWSRALPKARSTRATC